jgi:ABC-type nitrate/sulfonate/bicarbonate transport system permease component
MKKNASNKSKNDCGRVCGIVILVAVLGSLYKLICMGVSWQPDNQTEMPSLMQVTFRFFVQFSDPWLLKALLITLRTLGVSLFFALVLGLFFGFLFGSKKQWAYTQPTVDFLRSIPVTFLIPVLAILYGSSNILNIYLLTIYPTSLMVMFGVRTGIMKRDIERLHFFTVISSKRKTVRCMVAFVLYVEKIKLLLFETFPDIFSGFRVALSYGLVVVTVLEYMHIGVSEETCGIGTLLDREMTNHATINIFALVFLIGTIGFLLNGIAETIQRKWIHWSNENLKK